MSNDKDNALAPYIDYDLDTAAAEMKEQQSQAEDEAQIFFKARQGENVLRVVPPAMVWQDWFKEQGVRPSPFFMVWKHFFERPDKPGAWISTPCPHKMAVGVCPLCHQAAKLRATGDPVDDEQGWDMTAKHKVLMNVIDRDNPDLGPLIWEISAPMGRWKGRTMYEKLRALMTGRNAANIVTPTDRGFDIILTKTGQGRTGTTYTLQAERNPRALSEDPEQAMAWINAQHDLRRYVVSPTPDQMTAIIEGRATGPRGGGGNASVRQGATGGGRGSAPSRAARAIASAPAEPTAGDFVDTETVDEDDLQF